MTGVSREDDRGSTSPRPAESPGVSIELTGLTMTAGGRELLQNAHAVFPAGQVTLLLGCSGVGKSVLLRILAGLIERRKSAIDYSGEIRFRNAQDQDVDQHSPIAVVFQNFALFDELTPQQNVQIALDHCGGIGSASTSQRASALLQELRVPSDRPTGVLSGGQRQRLAIARAIGMDTQIILYDEPTSGLDVQTGARVADLIRSTQQQFQRTTVIVTHDHESLRRIADRIIIFDHRQKSLVVVEPQDWDQLPKILGEPPAADGDVVASASVLGRAGQKVAEVLIGTSRTVEECLALPFDLLPVWKSPRWGLKATGHYLNLVAGWSACVYLIVAGVILGFVSQDFIFRYLPFRQFTEPLLIENLLQATGFSLYRFLIPILATILIAARSGAAVAADVGSKVYGNQMDAMKTIGIVPERSVRTPILYAFLIGTPCLTLLSYLVAAATAAFAFLLIHPELGISFWDSHFHRELMSPQGLLYRGTEWLIPKLLCCGAGIAMISWRCGIAPKLSGPEISTGVTRSILWSTLFVLFVHFVFSLFEFNPAK
ncbi:MAG: ABC transporter permease [Planctomycetaceae bacterium]|nr:ABC transporter permease [Planctomycetaceae bacterium]